MKNQGYLINSFVDIIPVEELLQLHHGRNLFCDKGIQKMYKEAVKKWK